MKLERIGLWRKPFKQTVDDLRRKPFVWGENDCGIGLACKLTLAITGVDFGAPYRGRYDSAASAYRLMRDEGFDDFADLVASILPEVHPSKLRIGDLAAIAVDSPFKHALGVVNGERIFVLTEAGFGTRDLLDAARAFKVG